MSDRIKLIESIGHQIGTDEITRILFLFLDVHKQWYDYNKAFLIYFVLKSYWNVSRRNEISRGWIRLRW